MKIKGREYITRIEKAEHAPDLSRFYSLMAQRIKEECKHGNKRAEEKSAGKTGITRSA